MQKGQSHPAALVSQKLITEALVALIHEKGYRHITITELCARADVARRTFYRNFDTIEDVLRYLGGTTIEAFSQEMARHAEKSYYEILVAFFAFWQAHEGVFALFAGNNLTHILFAEYIKSLAQMPFLCEPIPFSTSRAGAYWQAYNAGGLWSMLMYHSNANEPMEPEEFARILTRQA